MNLVLQGIQTMNFKFTDKKYFDDISQISTVVY